jgi:Ca-activated chloride channel homolog
MFSFAWPWIFLCLPLPFLIHRFIPRATGHQNRALMVPFLSRIEALQQSQSSGNGWQQTHWWLSYIAWVLLVVAAANPQWLGKPIALPQQGRSIMLALDISGSMRIPDMQLHGQLVNRLQTVKQVATQFIEGRRGDRLGLILFGSRAYLQTPLTFDRKTVHKMLDDATIGLAGQYTAIGDAIGLAIKRLIDTKNKSRVLILLTDGANNRGSLLPLSAAKIAKKDHIKIYTIGIGANRLMVPGIFGPQMVNPSSDLDDTTLRKIASLTGGLFFRATDAKALQKIYQTIDKLEPVASSKQVMRPVTALFYWPLGLAFLIILILLYPKRS